jgi:hypothetical protein
LKTEKFGALLSGLKPLEVAADVALRLNVARFYEAFQDGDKALAVYRSVIADQPGTPAADASHYRAATILARLGEHADAVTSARRITATSAIPLADVRNNWRCELLREIENDLDSLPAMRVWKDFFAGQRTLPDMIARADAQRAWLRLMRETTPRLAGLADASGYKFLPVVTPIALEAHSELWPEKPLVPGDLTPQDRIIQRDAPAMRNRILSETGVRVPGTRLRATEELPPGTYVISLHEVPKVMGTVYANERFCPDEEACRKANLQGRSAIDQMTGGNGVWLSKNTWAAAEHAGLELLDAYEFMMRHLEFLLRKHLDSFFGIQEFENTIESWQSEAGFATPEFHHRRKLIARVLPDAAARAQLVQVLQRLLHEQVSIADLDTILRAFVAGCRAGKRPLLMMEDIRLALHPMLLGRPDTWRWFKVSPRFEKALLAGVRGSADDPHFALAAEDTQKLLAGLRAQISSTDRAALVVNDAATRALLTRLAEFEFPHCAVLSEEEIILELPPFSGVVDFEPEP